MQLTLQQIATITNGKLIGSDIIVNSIAYDSRLPFKSDSPIFVALITKSGNGHEYIQGLIEKKCSAFLISNPNAIVSAASFVLVNNTLTALQSIAAFTRKQFKNTVIGITGSTGKTTVKEWLGSILSPDNLVFKSPKSFNSQLGVAISAIELDLKYELAILEAGISRANEMQNLEAIIKPNIGLITNIGEAHKANFNSYESKLLEKLQLFKSCDSIVYCRDQGLVHSSILSQLPRAKPFSWGYNQNATVRVISKKSDKVYCEYNHQKISISLTSGNDYYFENIMHCVTMCLMLSVPLNQIIKGVKEIKPLPMRLEMKQGQYNTLLVNDSYSADFHSLEVALDYLIKVAGNQSKTLILSEFDEQNVNIDTYIKRLNKLIGIYQINRLVLIGERFLSLKFLNVRVEQFDSTQQFINHNSVSQFANEAILIKGARKFKLERLLSLFQAKSHRTRLEINQTALQHNYKTVKRQLAPNTQVMVMLKALGYGAGTFELARLLQNLKANYIAVAYIDEGVELRQKGITTPIMVLSPEGEGFYNLLQYQLEPEVYSFELVNELLEFLRDAEINKPLPVHVNIDTGMKRLGFEKDTVKPLGQLLNSNQNLVTVKSVFTHLAASDNAEHDAFTQQQVDYLKNAILVLRQSINYSFLVHAANTAGILRTANAQFDMVRLGIGFYGIDPSANNNKLRLAFKWVTEIIQIKHVGKGNSVGYSRSWRAPQDSIIATIPVGYADGLSRKLGNEKGAVYINGHKAEIVGAVCMDMCMVNVTKIKCKVADEVVIFENAQQLNELCKAQNTIPYELLAQISTRVKRIYLEE